MSIEATADTDLQTDDARHATPAPTVEPVDAASEFFVEAFAPERRIDPYPLYHRMRAHGPVISTDVNMHLAFGHDVCWSALRHPLASSDERHGTAFQRMALTDPRLAALNDTQPSLLFMDPPQHTRLRGLVAKAFTPRRVDELRIEMQRITDELLDDLTESVMDSEHGVVDIVDRYAYPLPITVICSMLGVPAADHDRFKDWSAALTKSVDPGVLRSDADNEAIELATTQLNTYTAELLADRRAHPGDDLLTALLPEANEVPGTDRLGDGEIVDLVTLLLVAGHETTVNLIGNGLAALLAHRDQLDDWHRHPAIAANAVEELLRYDSPLQMVQRIATEDIIVAGTPIPAGDQVIIMLGAANRDPSMFADPDRLDLRRANAGRHVSFGGGIHHCLGAALARVEGTVALDALIARFPHIRPAGEPTFRSTFNLRGRARLPVTLA